MANHSESRQALVQEVRRILAEKGQLDSTQKPVAADASAVERHLHQVSLAGQTLPTSPDLRDSPVLKFPLIGPLDIDLGDLFQPR